VTLRVLFIGGYGRSGSTLLDRVLGETPGVQSLGEVRHLWREGLGENRRCGCGMPFQDCPYWMAVLRGAFGADGVEAGQMLALQQRVDRWWRIPALAAASPGEEARRYAGVVADLYHAAAAESGARLLVDSSKDVSHGYVLRNVAMCHPDIDVRVVHLVRDPRAVAFSWLRHKDNPGSGRPMDRWPAWRTAVEWDVINAGVAGLRRLGMPYLRVGYDELITAPRATVERILEFGGAPDAPVAVDGTGTVMLHPSHTAAGNPNRFRSGPTTIAGDSEWRTRMRARDRAVVSLLSGRAPRSL
jgi:hypothetical protein